MPTLKEVQRVIKVIEPVAKQHGLIVALYGSVLRNGRGNDIDLLVVPYDWTSFEEISKFYRAVKQLRMGDLTIHMNFREVGIVRRLDCGRSGRRPTSATQHD